MGRKTGCSICGERMAQSDVFRPSSGPLLVRGNLSDGVPSFSNRPQTQDSGYRFGRLSHNSFFARHNPHPNKVRHIKGLLDVPICSVNDGGYFANPRYSMQFPPNAHDTKKLRTYSAQVRRLPASVINVNNQMYPIDTITGLQSFLGKPLNFRVFREKAVPKMGMVPVSEAWRDELRALTEAVGVSMTNLPKIADSKPKKPATADGRPRTDGGRPRTDGGRPRTSQYSANTGRLIPPPSRAMSRQASRGGVPRTPAMYGNLEHIAAEPDMENMILQMLCQILQTDDVNAVQSWLLCAGDREKALALDMIRSAISGQEDYYKRSADQDPTTFEEGQIIGARSNDLTKRIDRLSIDGDRPPSPVDDFPEDTLAKLPPLQEEDDSLKPVCTTDDMFRPGKSRDRADRPKSGLQRVRTPNKPSSPPDLSSEAKLRYTITDIKDQDIASQKKGLQDVLDA